MRAFSSHHGSLVKSLVVATLVASTSCSRQEPAGPATVTIANAGDLPAVYTPQQCANVVRQFPGWANVGAVPELDASGRPTIFYAAITITHPVQLLELEAVGIHTEKLPMFMDRDTRAKFDGQTGYVSKSTCGGAEIVWGFVPGPIFNRIAQDTVAFNETLVEAIVFLPPPDQIADPTITVSGVHPLSYAAVRDAGFRAPNDPPPNGVAVAGVWDDITSVAGDVWDGIKGGAKDIVLDGAKAWNYIKDGVPRWSGEATCWFDDCVQVGVHLDLRNTDPAFGGQKIAGGNDGTTSMTRAWGSRAGQALSIPGVKLTLRQSDDFVVFDWPISFEGTVQPDGAATVRAVTGKNTDFCLTLENQAATLNDELTARQLCSFSHILTTTGGAARANTRFSGNDQVNLRIEDKYVNVLAQLTDGYDYLKTVAGYTPRKAKVLSGWPLNVPGIKQLIGGRAVTPCLNFPNVAVDGINSALDSLAEALPPGFDVLGYVFAGAVEATYEDDMWLPDNGDILTSRGVTSHEYGHFAMCSLLYDEDSTKMVTIPSLIVQRAFEGKYGDATDETAYIMEGWADFFAGQLVSGANYFHMKNEVGSSGSINYCRGDSSNGPCWDWNFVEDLDATKYGSSGSVGFLHQVRRVATTLFDAFDGHGTGSNAPGEGDFWTQGSGSFVQAGTHTGDAHDEVIALPGSALRSFVHNWTHATWPLGWRVNQQQFFGALHQTIQGTPAMDIRGVSVRYNWCDECRLFSQHDGLSCGITGNTSAGGVCVGGAGDTQPQMSIQQMVTVCEQSPTIPSFIGPPPTTDPQSACTFTGCGVRSILVGEVGTVGAKCVACGPHQVSTGSRSCPATECPVANASATTCVACPDDRLVGGTDGNTCVACPALQIPNADRTACIPCGPHQVAAGTVCVDCANDQIAMPSNTCEACPGGQMPYSNITGIDGPDPQFGESCVAVADCTCNVSACRKVGSYGICRNVLY